MLSVPTAPHPDLPLELAEAVPTSIAVYGTDLRLRYLNRTRPANHVGARDGIRPWFFQGSVSA